MHSTTVIRNDVSEQVCVCNDRIDVKPLTLLGGSALLVSTYDIYYVLEALAKYSVGLG